MFAAYLCYMLALAGFTAFVSAVPLNINLGAYSPALVVGDGEISFGGKADVNTLMTALEGAAVTTASNVAAESNNGGSQGTVIVSPEGEKVEKQDAREISTILGGQRKEIEPRLQVVKSQDEAPHAADASSPVAKRDIQGFDRALQYAESALVKGPKVQLGTGAEGSGVGIIVDNNQDAARRPGRGVEGGQEAARPAAPVAAPVAPAPVPVPGAQIPVQGTTPVQGGAPAQESIQEQEGMGRVVRRAFDPERAPVQRRAKVTTMYVRSGIPADLNGASAANLVARKEAQVPEVLAKRDNANTGFDSVNLNVPAEGVTMTFVESGDEED